MAGVIFELISAEEQWEIFDDAARRLLNIDGSEFARRWDGAFLDRDEPGGQVAILDVMAGRTPAEAFRSSS